MGRSRPRNRTGSPVGVPPNPRGSGVVRIRSYHTDLFVDEPLADLAAEDERTLVRLHCYCDDEGRGLADPRLVASQIYPFGTVTADEIAIQLKRLEGAAFLRLYDVDGIAFLAIDERIWRHQKPNRKVESKLPPPPPTHERLTDDSLSPRERGRDDAVGSQVHVHTGVGEGVVVGEAEGTGDEDSASHSRGSEPLSSVHREAVGRGLAGIGRAAS